jgi:hypothetical protein
MKTLLNKKRVVVLVTFILIMSLISLWLINIVAIFMTTKEFDSMKMGKIKIITDENRTLELEVKIADEDAEQAAGFQYVPKEIIDSFLGVGEIRSHGGQDVTSQYALHS